MDSTVRSAIRYELRVKPSIDPAAEVRRRVEFLADYLKVSGSAGFVLGISGGQDSTLAGKLAQLAAREVVELGGHAIFVAVRLPYGTQADEADAAIALDLIQPDRTSHHIQPRYFSGISDDRRAVFHGVSPGEP